MPSRTKQPTGIAIKRQGNLKYLVSWKIADKNHADGQQLRWRLWRTTSDSKTDWTNVTIGPGSTSKTIELTVANYYPTTDTTFSWLEIQLRGKRATAEGVTYLWSNWEPFKKRVNVPANPTVTAELDSVNNNVTTFTWTAPTTDETRPFVNVEWQTMLVRACSQSNGAKLTWKSSLGWSTGTGSATGSQTFTEDTARLANDSYTRWFRVRARGAGGASAWIYANHVYARPAQAKIDKVTSSVSGGNTQVVVNWTAQTNNAHPIDSTTVQYLIDTPLANMVCPSEASWVDASVSADTSEKDGARFNISGTVGTDKCLWVRVNTQHDSNITYGVAKVVRVGQLADPSNLSVTTNNTTYRATVTATDNSQVPDSKIAIIYRTKKTDTVVGILPHGGGTVTVQCPSWRTEAAIAFVIYTFQGTYTTKTGKDNVTVYAIEANMKSGRVWTGGDVPVAPSNVTASRTDREGEVMLTWNWDWADANIAEVSWSTNPNAWESTEAPTTYQISSLNAAQWRISGLEMGQRWYFRVRLLQQDGEAINYGPYSEAVYMDLASAPMKPVLQLSAPAMSTKGQLTASWGYVTTDGTEQINAEVREATVSGSTVTPGRMIVRRLTAQNASIKASKWSEPGTYYLVVRVTSASGLVSEYSDPVPVTIVGPISCSITATSLSNGTVTDEDGNTYTALCLKAMPLTASVSGAGAGGTSTLVIERKEDYHMERPDGSTKDGYAGETVYLKRKAGDASFTVNQKDLLGVLDDGCWYTLIATTEDDYGQSATASIDFLVYWTHQAGVPGGTASIVDGVARIRPTRPSNYTSTDRCDIYRLTADAPELIYEGAVFLTTYVDPYPAIGDYGYRLVTRTANGDYITEDNHIAWLDLNAGIDEYSIIVDFDGRQLVLPYDISMSNKWTKDFQLTNYLGGSQQGDWNPAVTRTATYNVTLIADEDDIEGMRALAAYNGICHIRTPEGSSYACDIQVTEAKAHSDWDAYKYTLTVTKVDSEEPDGMTLAEWNNQQEE